MPTKSECRESARPPKCVPGEWMTKAQVLLAQTDQTAMDAMQIAIRRASEIARVGTVVHENEMLRKELISYRGAFEQAKAEYGRLQEALRVAEKNRDRYYNALYQLSMKGPKRKPKRAK